MPKQLSAKERAARIGLYGAETEFCTHDKGEHEIRVRQAGPWFVHVEIEVPYGPSYERKVRTPSLTFAKKEALEFAEALRKKAEALPEDTGDY